MTKEIKPNNHASRYLMGLGVLLTLLVVYVFWYSHFYGEVCNYSDHCISKWDYLKKATPNEIGDTLAGYAGTLAFVWIVVTVCLQAIELREQRLEFTRMADAQAEQVKLLVKQGDIFQEEQKQRAYLKFERELEQRLKGIQFQICGVPSNKIVRWMFKVDDPVYEDVEGQKQKKVNRYSDNEDNDTFFRKLRDSLDKRSELSLGVRLKFDGLWHESHVKPLLHKLKEVESLSERLADDQKIRLVTLGVSKLILELEAILSGTSEYVSSGAVKV